ncbi:helix-turn-helix domain-containing protein [Haloarchaeobius sp. TZWSO28]|uniref:helix-turn-helix domain-containing protein n=1 Tax=Haloarchaeobius sp. TZWSO28 TaxID=3446119 RepID=UPI003EBEC25D
MAIVAEILLRSKDLPLVRLAGSLPNGEISLSNAIPMEDDTYLFMVSVDETSHETFQSGLHRQPEIDDWTEIGRTAEGWFYQVFVDADPSLFDAHDPAEFAGVMLEATITGEGVVERKVFSDFDSFTTFQDWCAMSDLSLDLLNIATDPENPEERARFGLTDRQYRAVSLAFAGGYYDSPRRMSTQELADELGIAAASASDLLRRAEHQLLSQTLGPKQHLKTLTA